MLALVRQRTYITSNDMVRSCGDGLDERSDEDNYDEEIRAHRSNTSNS